MHVVRLAYKRTVEMSLQQTPRTLAAAMCTISALCGAFLTGKVAWAQCEVPAGIGGAGGLSTGVDFQGNFAFAVEHSRLTSFDISDPADPRPVATLQLSGNFLWDVKVSDGIAVCADAFWGVRIVDVHDPAAPFYLATHDTPYGPESVAIADGIVYAADGQSSVQVIDVTDPQAPFLLSSIPIYHNGFYYAQEVILVGSTLYIGSEAYGKVALDVVDVSNPSMPDVLGSLVLTPGYPVGASDLAVDGTIVYLTENNTGLHVIDATDPSAPAQMGSLPDPAGVVKPYGTNLLLGRGASVDVVDVSDPVQPEVIGNVALPHAADDIAITGDSALVSLYDHGLATLDLTDPDAPMLVATSHTPDEAMDVKVVGGLAYVADGQFGLKILDLTNPIVPAPVGEEDTPGSALGVDLAAGVVYIADAESGLSTIDVSDPTNPMLLTSVDTAGVAEDVAVVTGLAFVADGSQGLRIFDVFDPSAPQPLGSVPFPGVNAEATSVAVAGNLAYATDRFYGLRIIDVTDPNAPFIRSTTDTYSYAYDVVVDGTIAYVADYSKRVYVIDVSNPDAPTILWSGPQNGAATALALVGDLLYVAQGQGGYMETYDVSNPIAPVQLPSTIAPTLGSGLAQWDEFIISAHQHNGVRTFHVNGLPVVLGPQDVQSPPGADASLSVAAAGQNGAGAVELGFQWRRDGVQIDDGPTGSGSILGGTTTAVLTITNVQPTDEGAYDVEVANTCGTVVSATAQVTVDLTCGGDTDGNGAVDINDLLTLLGQWGTPGPQGDVNGDGLVGILDLLALLSAWGPC